MLSTQCHLHSEVNTSAIYMVSQHGEVYMVWSTRWGYHTPVWSTRSGPRGAVHTVRSHSVATLCPLLCALCTVPSATATQVLTAPGCHTLRPDSPTVRPERALKAVCPTPTMPPLPALPGFGVSLKRSHILSFCPECVTAKPRSGPGDWRNWMEFPASHESGVHSLILSFRMNSWNITCFLIRQKHLH